MWLYSRFLDPPFLNISKEVKDRSSKSNTSTSKKISCTKDVHTHVIPVIADNFKNSDYDTSNNDEDLGNFFAMTPGAENAQPIEPHPGYGYNMLVIVSGVISGVINKMSPIIGGKFAIMVLLSQVPPTLAQSTENEDDTPTLAHILVALVTAVICFFIANKITCKIDNYLTNSESDEESDEEDSSNEEDNSDEGNSGIDIPTGDSTPVVPLSTIVKFKEGTTLEEYFVSIGFTAKTFEIRHLLLRAKEIIQEENLFDCSNISIILPSGPMAQALGTSILHVSELVDFITPHIMVISTPKLHETASVQEVSHLDQLNLITPSPALHRFLLTAEPTYDGDKLTHSDICSVLSKYILQNHNSIKTERTKILKLSQHNPLYSRAR